MKLRMHNLPPLTDKLWWFQLHQLALPYCLSHHLV